MDLRKLPLQSVTKGQAVEKYGYVGDSSATYAIIQGCSFNDSSYTVKPIYDYGYYTKIVDNVGANTEAIIINPFPIYSIWYPNITLIGLTDRGSQSNLPQPIGLASYSSQWGYMALGTNLILDVTGGSADVNVTIWSCSVAPNGAITEQIVSVLGTPPFHDVYLPVGVIIKFGNYTIAPTVVVCGT